MHTHADVRLRVRAGSHGDAGASARGPRGGGDLGVLAQALFEYALSDSFAGGEANPSVIKADTTSIGSAFLGTALGAGRIQSGIEPSTRGDVPWRGEPVCCAALGERSFGRPAGATRPSTKTRSSALSQRNRSRQSQRIRAIARGPSALVPSAPPARPRGSDQGLRPPPS